MGKTSTEVDLIVASVPDWRSAKLEQLRQIVLSVNPEIQETVKWKMPSKPLGSPVWELAGIICVADYLKKAVRLTFPKGTQLADPEQIFNCRLDSKVARGIDFFDGEQINIEGLKFLITASVALNSQGG